MAIVVVGGSSRGVGKTALVCGLIAALPEFRWIAVKITSHEHGNPRPLWEESNAGQGTDTSRYLAAGAGRALLLTAQPDELGPVVCPWLQSLREQEPLAHVIFESNRVVECVQPDLCLVVAENSRQDCKPSFSIVERQKHATVAQARQDSVIAGAKPVFQLAAFEHISPEMLAWLREQMQAAAKMTTD
jgi:hypothetical protein